MEMLKAFWDPQAMAGILVIIGSAFLLLHRLGVVMIGKPNGNGKKCPDPECHDNMVKMREHIESLHSWQKQIDKKLDKMDDNIHTIMSAVSRVDTAFQTWREINKK